MENSKNDLQNSFFKNLVSKASEEQKRLNAEIEKRKHFQELGRKGGRKTKRTPTLDRFITIRCSGAELNNIKAKAQQHNLGISAYGRLILLERELRINEFKTDQEILKFASNFIHIKNLLRNREWSAFENKKEILQNVEGLIMDIRAYLYNRQSRKRTKDE